MKEIIYVPVEKNVILNIIKDLSNAVINYLKKALFIHNKKKHKGKLLEK